MLDNILVKIFTFGLFCCLLLVSKVKTFFYCFLDWSSMESGEKILAETRALSRTIWSQISSTSLSLFPILAFWLAFILHLSHLPPAYQNLHNQASIFHSIAPFPLMRDFPPRFWSCLVLPLFHRCVWLKYSPEEEKYQRRISQFLLPSPCDLIICAVETRFYFSLLLSWCFLASATMFLPGCFWMEAWQFFLLNYIQSLLGF